MAEGPYLLGIDFGTGGARVGIFTREGEPVAFESDGWKTHHPRPGRAEQSPDDWWSCLVRVAKSAMAKSGVSPDDVVGVSVDTTGSTVLAMDSTDRNLGPAIMWMDVRASEQARRIGETGDPALKYSGFGSVSAEWGMPKALWIKEEQPEVFRRAAHICDCGDWLVHRLTGEWATSINIVSAKYFYDREKGGWPRRLYASVDAEDVLEKFPRRVLDLGDVVGGLRRSAAEELGLRADTPVAQGAIDGFSGALGLGVVEPGKMAFITGSSHTVIGQSEKPIHGKGFWGAYTDALVPGQYTVEAGQVSTGSVVSWFKDGFAPDVEAEAKRRGTSPFDILEEMAANVPVGSDGLLVLDYFQGNRSPYTDPLARGMIWGLSLGHGPGHVFRAIIEGICYGTEHIFRTMRVHDLEPKVNVVSGGPAKSALWMQMHADISNIPISFTKVSEGPVLGSAMLAAVGAGIYPDVREAAKNMVHVEKTVEPDPDRHEQYRFYVDRYIETYPRMKDLMHSMAAHESSQHEPAVTD